MLSLIQLHVKDQVHSAHGYSSNEPLSRSLSSVKSSNVIDKKKDKQRAKKRICALTPIYECDSDCEDKDIDEYCVCAECQPITKDYSQRSLIKSQYLTSLKKLRKTLRWCPINSKGHAYESQLRLRQVLIEIRLIRQLEKNDFGSHPDVLIIDDQSIYETLK